eukprot:XP_003724809.1 PREDICTED: serine/arginine repetitive matrix protein 1 [Strongylocentrotus purpuratus]
MAQPPRRVKSATESRRRNMESSANGNSAINGAASGKAATSPYSQSVSSVSKGGHGSSEITRRVSQRDKPAIPAKPSPSKVPPPKYHGKSNGTSNTMTTGHSKTQSSLAGSEKREGENRVNGVSQVKKTNDVNGEARPPSGKSRYCLEITLEKKVSTPTVRRKQTDREVANSIASSSEESSPSQSPSKSVHFKSSRSNSASSIDSRDRMRFGGIPGSVPRYMCPTISSTDKTQRTKSATSKTDSGMIEASSDTQLNGSSNGTPGVEPIRRGRARSVGPIRRVRSNEMMPPKRDLSPSPKSGKITQVRSKSVERSKSSFGSFVQRQRKAWEERVTTVTRRAPLSNVAEKNVNRRSLDPNHAPKIMQKSTSVTQRKHMLFGKGANVQKVKTTIDGNQVNKPTSPTSLHNKSDASQQVPKTKSSSNDSDLRTSAKAEVNGRVGSKGYAQGDSVASSDQKRTSIVDNPPDKPSVLQEIAPVPSSKPNAPNSLPVKPVYQNTDLSHRVSTAKENKIGMLVTDLDALDVNGADEMDNGKSHLFIDEGNLGIKPECLRFKPQSSDTQEEYSEILGLTDPKEINKLNSETLHSLKKVDKTFLEVEKKKDTVVDKVKEQEKAGICNGEDVGEKDGHYFLKVVNVEQSRIESLCRKVEHDLESDMSDEAGGICRAFLGKANLLTSKKFKQFRGLCEENITPSDEPGKTTLASDLAGFWDMVMIQVDEMNSKFIDIETLKDNNWKVTAAVVTKPTPRKTPAKRGYGRQVSRDKDDKATQGAKDSNKKDEKESRAAKMRAAREEARKRLIAAKKQAARQRIRSNSSESEVEIFTASGQQQS